MLERYVDWLGDAVQLDFGKSYPSYNNVAAPDVAEEIKERIPVSLGLALAGLFVAIIIGIPLGILSGMRPGGPVDRSSVTGTSFGLAIPNFVLAFFLIQVFALDARLVPRARLHEVQRRARADGCDRIVAAGLRARRDRGGVGGAPDRAPRSSTCCSRTTCAPRSRSGTGTRRVGREVRVQERGDPDGHRARPPARGPLGGVVIIEQIFVDPGPRHLHAARARRCPTCPVIQAVTITFVVIYVMLNLIVDISYGYLNPRVRVS